MAAISDLLPSNFDNATLVVSSLDIGIFNAGKMAQVIYDLAAHSNGPVDPESVAAAAQSLIALLVQLGPLVDHLEGVVRPMHLKAA